MEVKSESEVAQSCLTLSDPMDRNLPGSSVHGIFQARVLEWGAIAFSAVSLYLYVYIERMREIVFWGIWRCVSWLDFRIDGNQQLLCSDPWLYEGWGLMLSYPSYPHLTTLCFTSHS